MTFKEKYKRDNEKIIVSEDVMKNLSNKLHHSDNEKNKSQYKNKYKYKLVASIASSAAVVALIFIFSLIGLNKANIGSNSNFADKDFSKEVVSNNKEGKDDNVDSDNDNSNLEANKADGLFDILLSQREGIEIPKIRISRDSYDSLACRVSTLVYNGNVYEVAGSNLTLEEGKAIIDRKLGLTEGLYKYIQSNETSAGYVEWDELPMLVGDQDNMEVYTVKGYDERFRLITIEMFEGKEYLRVWECLNGITISSGKDIFDLMSIKGNINKVTWDTFNNWNYGTPNPIELPVSDIVNNFIEASSNSKALELDEELNNELYYKENYSYGNQNENQKFLYLKLNDGTEITLRLFSNGYIKYSSLLGVVFKVEDNAFNKMWDYLK